MAPEVDLFVPCLTDTFHPRAAAATVAVLEHLGCRVHFPDDQTCCGQAHRNAGCTDDAAALIRRMAQVFPGERPIVTPSGSCAAMVARHAVDLVPGDDPDAPAVRSLAARTRELSRFLLDDLRLDVTQLGARWPGDPTTAAWHFPCHLRELGGDRAALQVLAGIEGLRVAPIPDAERCCGFGGTFAVDEPAISGALGRDKARSFLASGAEILICDESGCALQIAGTLSRLGHRPRLVHFAEVLAESLGLAIPGEEIVP